MDVNECLDEYACGLGTCVNIEGGFECICPEGFMLSSDGQECVDMRKEMCFMTAAPNGANCSKAMSLPQTKVVCCCSMGAAWGLGCELCPEMGTADYQTLCGNGAPGMMVDPISGATHEIDECLLMPGLETRTAPVFPVCHDFFPLSRNVPARNLHEHHGQFYLRLRAGLFLRFRFSPVHRH